MPRYNLVIVIQFGGNYIVGKKPLWIQQHCSTIVPLSTPHSGDLSLGEGEEANGCNLIGCLRRGKPLGGDLRFLRPRGRQLVWDQTEYGE
jgi:hypothetical protein